MISLEQTIPLRYAVAPAAAIPLLTYMVDDLKRKVEAQGLVFVSYQSQLAITSDRAGLRVRLKARATWPPPPAQAPR